MSSKLPALRDAFVVLISGIANTELGFDDPGGNIHSYLYDFERGGNLQSNYLSATINAKKETRAWGVQVLASQEQVAMDKVFTHSYATQIVGYYPTGASGINLLIDHSEAIKTELRVNCSGIKAIVDLELDTGEISISVQDAQNADGQMLVGVFTVNATADFKD